MENYNNLVEAIEGLKKKGFVHDFNIESHCVKCTALDLHLNPEEFEVIEFYRFEGDGSSPDGNSIIYAIESSDGCKGILVDAYGLYSEALNEAMIRKLKMH